MSRFESERIWKRKDLEVNGFGSEQIWKRKDLEVNGFGSEQIWKRKDLEVNKFRSERIMNLEVRTRVLEAYMQALICTCREAHVHM